MMDDVIDLTIPLRRKGDTDSESFVKYTSQIYHENNYALRL